MRELALDFNYSFLDTSMDKYKEIFLSGKIFDLQGSQLIFDKLNFSYYDYLQKVNYVKKVLSTAKLLYLDGIIFIKTNKELSEEEIIILVRYINICQKDKYVIILNNKLIYLPTDYNEYEKVAIKTYIYSVFNRYNNHRKFKVIKYKVKKFIKNLINKL